MLRICLCRSSRVRFQACRAYGSELPEPKAPAALGIQDQKAQDEGGDFWRQLEVLEQPKPGSQVFDRWDWHAGQLLVALLPAAAIYAIAMWARKDMARVEQELLEKDADPDASGTQSLRSFTASMQRKEKAAQSKDSAVLKLLHQSEVHLWSNQQTEARLSAMEQLLKELQSEMRAQHAQQQQCEQKPSAQASQPAQAAAADAATAPQQKRGH